MSQPSPTDTKTLALARSHHFRFEALAANRAGRLTPEQIRDVRRQFRNATVLAVVLGLGGLVIGSWMKIAPRSFPLPDQNIIGPITDSTMALLVGGFFLLIAIIGNFVRPIGAELAKGRVEQVEGLIRVQRSESGGEASVSAYAYHINGLTFQVTTAGAQLIDSTQRYRLYYLPRNRVLVNIEPI